MLLNFSMLFTGGIETGNSIPGSDRLSPVAPVEEQNSHEGPPNIEDVSDAESTIATVRQKRARRISSSGTLKTRFV